MPLSLTPPLPSTLPPHLGAQSQPPTPVPGGNHDEAWVTVTWVVYFLLSNICFK